ncbi:glycosyltransferase family 2 protein [Nocardioides piscis]|uniref:Glycosyltransferase family 92 protein n=1 Tax=Nocardioides piscis TaxID=2714938 RepID=A0A6G7YHA1_9ACTN|nr:glycosyltransferase family 2 protein [Nocardioides piscis]QIK76011.1 glycosyltransferase family 92 protein [Nocardioides piscis]
MPHVIVTQTRGDAHRLAEWVSFHAALGFDEFHILLDGVVDDSQRVLEALDVPARVETHLYPEEGDYYDGLSVDDRLARVKVWREHHREELDRLPYAATDPQSMRQFRRIRELLPAIVEGRRGWLAHIDVDEFINIPSGASITSLTAQATTPRLQLLNFNVDTTGYDPSRPVLAQQGPRWAREDLLEHPDTRWATRVKSIVRFRAATPFRSIHRISFGRHEVVDPDVARLHHFRVPLQPMTPPLPYTVDDVVTPRNLVGR